MTVYRAVIWARDFVHAPGCPLSMTARLLLYELAAHAGDDGTCSPSVTRLAEGLGIHVTNVRRARVELVAAGAIKCEINRGRGHANTYRFPFVAHPSANGDRPPAIRNGKPRTTARITELKPRTTARNSSPQSERQRSVSVSTNRAAALDTYPQTEQSYPETERQRSQNHAPALAKVGREVASREVARSKRVTRTADTARVAAAMANGLSLTDYLANGLPDDGRSRKRTAR
jgi:Helix-turn-helix domain